MSNPASPIAPAAIRRFSANGETELPPLLFGGRVSAGRARLVAVGSRTLSRTINELN